MVKRVRGQWSLSLSMLMVLVDEKIKRREPRYEGEEIKEEK